MILLDNLIFPQAPGLSLGQEEVLEEKELVLLFLLEVRPKPLLITVYFYMFGKCAFLLFSPLI